jgi:hypothetical protein
MDAFVAGEDHTIPVIALWRLSASNSHRRTAAS